MQAYFTNSLGLLGHVIDLPTDNLRAREHKEGKLQNEIHGNGRNLPNLIHDSPQQLRQDRAVNLTLTLNLHKRIWIKDVTAFDLILLLETQRGH